MSKQYLDKDGLQIVAGKVNESKEVASGAMALAEQANENITMTFTGTYAQWNSLSAADKNKYIIVNITDDVGSADIAVRNPDWSRAVAVSLADLRAGYMAPFDGIFICSRMGGDPSYPRINANITVNNVSVAAAYLDQNGDGQRTVSCQVPVNKGDVIQADSSVRIENTVSFVPYKYEFVAGQPLSYSTDEQFTGKFWIDGKKIYSKTVIADYTYSGTMPYQFTFAHGISDIDFVTDFDAISKNSSNGAFYKANIPHPSVVSKQLLMWVDTTNINVYIGDVSMPYPRWYVTIYYTKTTD